MGKKKPPPRIPPLSFEALGKIEKVEKYAQSALRDCKRSTLGWDDLNEEKALRILRTCVVEVFEAQLSYYSSLPTYHASWVRQLRKKTVDSALGLIPSLFSVEQYRGELDRTLSDHLAQRVRDHSLVGVSPQRIDRKKLRDSYLETFPGVKLLDICWAAGQHYSEWKRWLRYAVKDGSAPDRAFRAILTSGKSPSQYRKQRRPDGWK